MEALLSEFDGLFCPYHVFRPHRDLGFTDDKRPYKESIAGTVGSGRGTDAAGTRKFSWCVRDPPACRLHELYKPLTPA